MSETGVDQSGKGTQALEPRVNRIMPAGMSWFFIQALQQEIGDYTLNAMLRQAEVSPLEELSAQLEGGRGLRAGEYALLLAKIREYYGYGARGLLIRAGRTTWSELASQSKIGLGGMGLVGRTLLHNRVALRSLNVMLGHVYGKTDLVSTHALDQELYLVDRISDATYGQKADEPVCVPMLGLILGALSWGTGADYDVEEVVCRASGAEACKFRIRQ